MRRVGIGAVLIAAGCSGPGQPAGPTAASPRRVGDRPATPVGTGSIHAGGCHACRLDGTGELACWGCNAHGQLGDGTNEDRATPVAVRNLGKVRAVALGPTSTCAIEEDGRVACWGANDHLQLGWSGGDSALPRPLPWVTDGVRLAVGRTSACAIERGGALRCWGENRYWDRGAEDYGDQLPRRIDQELGIEVVDVRIDAANNACVLDRAGAVTCWGPDLGAWDTTIAPDATNAEREAFRAAWGAPVQRATGVRAFLDHARPVCVESRDAGGAWSCIGAKGNSHADASAMRGQLAIAGTGGCATSGGRVSCWGAEDDPMRGAGVVEALDDVVQVAAGGRFACALRAGGSIACWGDPANWRTGDAAMARAVDPPVPADHAPRPHVAAAAAPEPDCRIAKDRTVECRERGRWRTMARVRDAAQLSHGDAHVCARSAGGAVWCWGAYYYDSYSHDGDYTQVPRPHRVRGISATTIASWGERDCAFSTSNYLACWGRGIDELLAPVYVGGGSGTYGRTGLVMNDSFLCAWAPGQDVEPAQCWSTHDVLEHRDRATPKILVFGAAAIELAGARGCALHDDGRVSCWGDAIPGDGSWSAPREAVHVDGIEDATAIAVSTDHACALRRSGELWCWGENGDGELGDGTTADRVRPVRAAFADELGAIARVEAYAGSTVITTTDEQRWVWGAP